MKKVMITMAAVGMLIFTGAQAAGIEESGRLEQLVQQKVLKKHKHTKIQLAASFQMPSGKAEIAASTPDGSTLVVTEADLGRISLVSIQDLGHPAIQGQVSFQSLSPAAEVTSVTVTPDGRYALAAVRTGDNLHTASKGMIAVVELSDRRIVKTYEIGIGPDSIALSKDGKKLVICNEDEEGDPAQDNEVDMKKVKRPGTISILDFPKGDVLQGIHTELHLNLTGLGNGTIYEQDPQPEYVSISPNGKRAAVTLQENNAIAIVNLKTNTLEHIFGLGVTKHKADLKYDGTISFADNLTARPEPDGIVWDPSGRFLMTANEGDLGKDEWKDGVKSGGRNLSVWSPDGSLVYDSLNLIDEKAAEAGMYPDTRSPNRGSEVENLTTGKIQGSPILAVAAERSNAVLFFDVSYPAYPVYLGLVPSAGKAPEGIHNIQGRNLFVSADEADGVLSFYSITQ